MPASAPDWDARAYHRVSEPQFAWGLRVLERLSLRGDETVVDAGCGSGRLTRRLVDRLPRGRVIAVDQSAAMLEQARGALSDVGDRLELVQADLTQLQLTRPVDAIFSTATFHWVLDHEALFRSLHRALRPGGQLVAQCGGQGNLRRIRARAAALMATPAYRQSFESFQEAWRYESSEDTAARLRGAGFTQVQTWLEEAPTPFPDASTFKAFCRAVVLRLHVARLPDEASRERFLDELTQQSATDSPPFTLDYVRLNLDATR